MAPPTSFWRYQPVETGNVTGQVLPYDSAQVGAATDVTPHEDTNVPGGFQAYPTVVTDQPSYNRAWRSSAGNPIGWRPFIYQAITDEPPSSDYRLASSQSQGMTGTTVDPIETAEHGPTSTPEIALIAPQPAAKRTILEWIKCAFWPTDNNNAHREGILTGIGVDDAVDRDYVMSEAAVSVYNQFQMVDGRRTFDTPVLPGMVPNLDGKYRVGKAGFPATDNYYEPQSYEITDRRFPVNNNALPFLPDRVRAGAANPADPSQTRPADVPHWWYERLFDQIMAHRLTGQKGVMADKLSARPTQTSQEDIGNLDGMGSHGGNQRRTFAPGMTPAGPMPSTVRNIPEPWDSDLYSNANGQPGSARARGWR